MICSHCGYHVEHSDSFCSGCGIVAPPRRHCRSGPPAFIELARDVRLLTGSRRAMKFAIIPLIAVLALVAISGALEVLFRACPTRS